MSPLTSAVLSCFFLFMMCKFVLNDTHEHRSFSFRLQFLSVVAGISLAIIVLLITSIIFEDVIMLLTSW